MEKPRANEPGRRRHAAARGPGTAAHREPPGSTLGPVPRWGGGCSAPGPPPQNPSWAWPQAPAMGTAATIGHLHGDSPCQAHRHGNGPQPRHGDCRHRRRVTMETASPPPHPLHTPPKTPSPSPLPKSEPSPNGAGGWDCWRGVLMVPRVGTPKLWGVCGGGGPKHLGIGEGGPKHPGVGA